MAKRLVAWETAVDRYTLGPSIGSGGSGTVCEATDSAGQPRAIKALDLDKATSARRKRFQNELQFCMTTRHQNVVRVEDYGVSPEGAPFFVMARYPRTLRQQLAQSMKPDESVRLFAGILDGVEAAHQLGAWHRDLKPENILIHGTGVPVVADFGIAHFEQEELYTAVETRDNERLANFQYAAPEQRIRGRAVDQRADIYALGLMLNELFTGELALGSNPRRIASVAPDVAYLDDIVDSMIRQVPDERPASVDRVKQLLIGHRQSFISRQRLDALSRQVVRATDVTDPILADPVRIVTTDYQDGQLIFQLNHAVPPAWANALRSVGGPYTIGVQPHMVQVAGNTARMHAGPGREGDVKRLVDQWIDRANRDYAELVKAEAIKRERADRQRLEAEREQEQYRAKILKQLNP
jgi:serine/threonine protein kinase